MQAVVKVNLGTGENLDVAASRNSVGILKGTDTTPSPDDTFEVDFVYNVEASNGDIFDRTVLPLVRRVVQGYPAACILMGTTSSGKLDLVNSTKDNPGVLELAAEVRALSSPFFLTAEADLAVDDPHAPPYDTGAGPPRARVPLLVCRLLWASPVSLTSTVPAHTQNSSMRADSFPCPVSLPRAASPPPQELFSLLRARASDIAEQRPPAGRYTGGRPPSFSFSVECSFCELFCEDVTDLLDPSGQRRPLSVVEDRIRGWHARGLLGAVTRLEATLSPCARLRPFFFTALDLDCPIPRPRVLKSALRPLAARHVTDARALLSAYEEGRSRRRTGSMELGPASERTAALFTVTVSQRVPSLSAEDLPSHLLSTLVFADTPSTERLSADPEELRIREGVPVNQGLFAMRDVVRALSERTSADPLAITADTANYAASKLTLLLSEALGGNCFTAVVASVRQGEGALSGETLAAAAQARRVVNAPCQSHDRCARSSPPAERVTAPLVPPPTTRLAAESCVRPTQRAAPPPQAPPPARAPPPPRRGAQRPAGRPR